MAAKGAQIVDIDITIKAETPKAWLVESSNTGTTAWVPKSQGELDGEELTVPLWLAQDKGLI